MRSIKYIVDWYLNPSRRRGKVARPKLLNFPITDTCNARCVMCNIWRDNAKDDLNAEQVRRIFQSEFLSDLEHVGLSGGEPMLRSDLIDIVKSVLHLKELKSLSITSHGFNIERHKKNLPVIANLCAARGVTFVLNLSLDGVGDVHDLVRGVPGGFGKLSRTIEIAKKLGISILFQCTVSRANVFHLNEIQRFSENAGIPVIYRLATEIERLYNNGPLREVKLTPAEMSFFADFLLSPRVMRATRNPARRLFYRSLVRMMVDGERRTAPCYFKNEGVLLSSRGEISFCSISSDVIALANQDGAEERYFSPETEEKRAELLRSLCETCPHDQSGAWRPRDLILEQLRGNALVGSIASKTERAFLALKLVPSVLRVLAMRARSDVARRAPSGLAVIVGCYGGEHVGDAAILGGVALRLNRRYGTTRFAVCSFRPDRTRRWIGELRLPFQFEVVPYESGEIRGSVRNSDYAAVGGGPIMDLPVLLMQHMRAKAITESEGKPFVIEGVGFGPFRRGLSRRFAEALICGADAVTVRTKAAKDELKGVRQDVSVDLDPAFDYLASIDRGALASPAWLGGVSSRPLVGINLRPLWSRYATGDFSKSDVESIQERALDEIAGWIRERTDLDFVYFPMNADQFGMSDLDIAYQLRDRADRPTNLRIWEAEPGIEEVCGLLTRCTAVVAMRFHACIFALGMDVPVVGIDYGIGKTSKVSELLADWGVDAIPVEQVTRVALDSSLKLRQLNSAA